MCWDCKRKSLRKPKRTEHSAKFKASRERAANQETKEDEAAKRLPIQAMLEDRPCHRCGRAVLVLVIPVEERKRLGTLPVAVECEKPCEARVMA